MALPAESYQGGGAGRRAGRVPARTIVGPTSTVITGVDDWADASLLLFHEPIRLDLLEMDHVMAPAYFDGLSGWKTGLFYKWFKAYFHPLVSHHLKIFEAALLPAIMAKAPAAGVDREDLLAMHPWILNKLEQIRGLERRFKLAANRVTLARSIQEQRETASDLRACIKELLTCVTEHLVRIETALVPVIREHFSEEEWRTLVHQVLLGPLGKAIRSKQLPWMLAALRVWASPDRVAAFLASLPWATRFRLEYLWYCSYVNGPAKRLRLIKNEYLPW